MFISPNVPRKYTKETSGLSPDLKVLQEDKWLLDTEVLYRIQARKSLWYLTMVYVDVRNPMRFICRQIDRYHSQKKATTFAKILQRGIRKDARGTLKSNRDAFDICTN